MEYDIGKELYQKRQFFVEKAISSAASSCLGFSTANPSQLPPQFAYLTRHGPCFPVSGSNIQILHEPSEFYLLLKKEASRAKRRIVLASLYLNTGTYEQDLVESIYDNCSAAHRDERDLSITFLFDYFRGSRGVSNTRTICRRLLADFPQYVGAYLYHSPDLRGLLKAVTPERFNEVVGVTHLKVYLFDDALIMSGANLDDKYFTRRQDRYVRITDAAVADYFSALIATVTSFSLQLGANDSLSGDPRFGIDPATGDKSRFKTKAKQTMQAFLHSYRSKSEPNDRRELSKSRCEDRAYLRTDVNRSQEYSMNSQSRMCDSTDNIVEQVGYSCVAYPEIFNNDRHIRTAGYAPLHINQAIVNTKEGELVSEPKDIIKDYSATTHCPGANTGDHSRIKQIPLKESSSNSLSNECATNESDLCRYSDHDVAKDTWIFPLVQMGPLGICHDKEATVEILKNCSRADTIRLASGYFNLTDLYKDVIIHESPARFMLLIASPEVNGFYQASGLSRYIPAVYVHLAKLFYGDLNDHSSRISMYEYFRDKWSYHVKGLWYYRAGESTPSLTLIGSPNFGYRSVHRDLEAQVAIVTNNSNLKKSLHEENQRLFERSEQVTAATFLRNDRSVPAWVGWITSFIKTFF